MLQRVTKLLAQVVCFVRDSTGRTWGELTVVRHRGDTLGISLPPGHTCICKDRSPQHPSCCCCHLCCLQVVADRVLLARLVLLHEELRALAERQSAQPFWQDGGDATEPAGSSTSGSSMGGGATAGSSQQPFFAFHRSNLPARCAAFLKNLLTVQERNKRLGLLNKVRAPISKRFQAAPSFVARTPSHLPRPSYVMLSWNNSLIHSCHSCAHTKRLAVPSFCLIATKSLLLLRPSKKTGLPSRASPQQQQQQGQAARLVRVSSRASASSGPRCATPTLALSRSKKHRTS